MAPAQGQNSFGTNEGFGVDIAKMGFRIHCKVDGSHVFLIENNRAVFTNTAV